MRRFTEIERSLHKSQPEMFVICMCSIKQQVLGWIYDMSFAMFYVFISNSLFLACAYYEVPCPNGKKCIYRSQLCDSLFDCPSGFDELYCSGGEEKLSWLNPFGDCMWEVWTYQSWTWLNHKYAYISYTSVYFINVKLRQINL